MSSNKGSPEMFVYLATWQNEEFTITLLLFFTTNQWHNGPKAYSNCKNKQKTNDETKDHALLVRFRKSPAVYTNTANAGSNNKVRQDVRHSNSSVTNGRHSFIAILVSAVPV